MPGLGRAPARWRVGLTRPWVLSTARFINTVAALLPLSANRPANHRIPVSLCPAREAARRDRLERSGRLRLLTDSRELHRVRVSPG